ncbi:putative DNA-binding domain-containing protein [Motiliproteus sp.]|uniref:HvfC/BufC family peptide modification chaperone n=1 Tax=Motiliproteus sp. TaxID=1898955 RepID=UPI003BAC4FBB
MLAELQQQFADQLLAAQKPANGGDSSPLAISGPAPAAQLFQLYRNNFYVSLRERLEAVFPVTKALVGEEFFAQISNRYVREFPLTQAPLADYGDQYGDHIAQLIETNEAVASVPYLADVARLEWLLELAEQRPLQPNAFPFERLSALAPEQQAGVRLRLAPGVGLLKTDYAAAAIHQGVTTGELDGLDPNQSEYLLVLPAGTAWPEPLPRPQIQPLDEAAFGLLEAIEAGTELASLPLQDTSWTPALLIQRGLISDFELG